MADNEKAPEAAPIAMTDTELEALLSREAKAYIEALGLTTLKQEDHAGLLVRAFCSLLRIQGFEIPKHVKLDLKRLAMKHGLGGNASQFRQHCEKPVAKSGYGLLKAAEAQINDRYADVM